MEKDKDLSPELFKFSLISPLIHLDDREERQSVVESITGKDLEIPESGKNSLTPKTVSNYLKRYEKDGFGGLRRKKRSDSGKLKVMTEEVFLKIKALKEENPERTVNQIIRLIASAPGMENIVLKERTVSRILKDNRLTRKELKPKKIHYAFEKEHINELWQSDITDGIVIRGNNRMTHLFAFIDDYSRIIPHGQFYYDEKLPRLEDCLKKAILKRGIPKVLYVDNGKVFDATHLKRICAELGIRLVHHLPYSPQSKGKIERFFQRVQREFMSEAKFADIHSLEELNSFFFTWVEMEYHRVEHHAIGGTPIDRYQNDLKKTPVRKVESLEEITEIFLYREKRTVHTSSGAIRLNGNVYQSMNYSLLGREVEIRFDPFDLTKVFVYADGKFSEAVLPVDIKNQNYLIIPEENKASIQAIRQSSIDFFSRLKQKELEKARKENRSIDFTKLKSEDKNV